MIGFCPLASGSKGNSIFVGTHNTKILIDAGISAKATCAKLGQIGVSIDQIDAILITHEHADHIAGLKVLSSKYEIPVFANVETAKGITEYFHDCLKFKIFTTGETFEFGDMEIHPFSVQHDTVDPVMFTIKTSDLKLGFCTDIGFVTSLVRNKLQHCDYLYVESNHQPSMVHSSSRPPFLKQRILGRSGHLSNEECGYLLCDVAHPGLKHVHLAHLSRDCNTPDIALNTVNNILSSQGIQLDICVAHQDIVSKAIHFEYSTTINSVR